MGDTVEMMLSGILCKYCAAYTGIEEAPGHPMICSEECAEDMGYSRKEIKKLYEEGIIIKITTEAMPRNGGEKDGL